MCIERAKAHLDLRVLFLFRRCDPPTHVMALRRCSSPPPPSAASETPLKGAALGFTWSWTVETSARAGTGCFGARAKEGRVEGICLTSLQFQML